MASATSARVAGARAARERPAGAGHPGGERAGVLHTQACPGALTVPTDVRDEGAVEALAQTAIDRLGRLDVWVNSAGVIAYGRFTDVPADVFRAVIETNFFGQVHAARASLPRFRAQRSGVLVNVSSVWGRVTSPDVSAYVASKFAVRAFSECLRFEVRDEPGGNYSAAPAPPSPGNVLAPTHVVGPVHGGWRRRTRELAGALGDASAAAVRAIAGR